MTPTSDTDPDHVTRLRAALRALVRAQKRLQRALDRYGCECDDALAGLDEQDAAAVRRMAGLVPAAVLGPPETAGVPPVCSHADGCGEPAAREGLCEAHYRLRPGFGADARAK